MNRKPRLRLTVWLTLLVMGVAGPLLVFAGAMLWWVQARHEDEGQAELQDRVHAVAAALDTEIRAWKAAVSALAASNDLRREWWADFDAEARRVAAQYGGWVVVDDPTTQMHVNTLRPAGERLPKTNPEIRACYDGPGPRLLDPYLGTLAQRPILVVATPIRRDGTPVYCLHLNLGPERLTRLLRGQQLRAGWVAALVDRQHRLVARVPEPDTEGAAALLPGLQAAITAAPRGVVERETVLLDHREGRVAFQRLAEVPWTLTLAVPLAAARAARYTPLVTFGATGLLLGLLAVGLAVLLARRISRPIQALAARALGLVRGQAPAAPVPTDIAEVGQLGDALREAGAAARTYTATLEARVAERTAALEESRGQLQQANVALEAANAALRAALAAKDAALATNQTLLREVHHRVKNNLQMLCDLVYLQMEGLGDAEQAEILRDTYSRIYAIARLHEQLYQALQSGEVSLGVYLARLVGGFESLYPAVRVQMQVGGDEIRLDVDRALHVALIVNELVTNAVKHAFVDRAPGDVAVRLQRLGGTVEIQVRDTGKGLPPDLDLDQAKTLGLRIIRILAQRLQATVDIENRQGAAFTLRFPLHAAAAVAPGDG